MPRQIVLLRGINLASKRRVSMADLRAALEELGYEDVRTLLQSGNVVLTAKEKPAEVERRIEKRLASDLGFKVDVLVRTRDELAKIVEHDPLREYVDDPKLYHVVFLSERPPAGALKDVDPADYEPERFALHGRELYMWLPNGSQKAKLGHAFWEKRLKLTATARNWNTVEKLLAVADG